MLQTFHIEDDLAGASQGAIEVMLTLEDGTRRWCFFMTPEALRACGDWISGTQVRLHLGEPHMIVVSEISEAIVARVLTTLDRDGLLLMHSRPIAVSQWPHLPRLGSRQVLSAPGAASRGDGLAGPSTMGTGSLLPAPWSVHPGCEG